jgi:hypothetical protein
MDGDEDGGGDYCAVGGTSATPLLVDFPPPSISSPSAPGAEREAVATVRAVSCGSHHTAAIVSYASAACARVHYGQPVGAVPGRRDVSGASSSAAAAEEEVEEEAEEEAAEEAAAEEEEEAAAKEEALFAWGWNAHGQLGLGDRRQGLVVYFFHFKLLPLIPETT